MSSFSCSLVEGPALSAPVFRGEDAGGRRILPGVIRRLAARPRAVSTFFNPQFSTHLRGPGHRTARWVVTGVTFVAYALLPLAELGLIGSYVQTTLRTEA